MTTKREEFVWSVNFLTASKQRDFLKACGVTDDEVDCLYAALKIVAKKVFKSAVWGM